MADQAASPADPAPPETAPALTGVRRGEFAAYQGLLVLFLIGGVVQVFLAGLGVWDLDQQVGSDGETALDPHRTTGMILGVMALLILIAALVARPSGQAIGLSFVLVLLTYPVQSVLANAGEDTPILGGLHALDAFVILGLAGYLRGSTAMSFWVPGGATFDALVTASGSVGRPPMARYPARGQRPAMPVLADVGGAFAGRPLPPWPAAVPDEAFTPPARRGVPRLFSDAATGRCAACGRALPRRLDGGVISHKAREGRCEGSGQRPAEDVALASWRPLLPA